MTLNEAQQIIDTLARGIDPDSGELLPADSCLASNPQVIRALFLASGVLQTANKRIKSAESKPGMAGKPWTPAEDELLLKAFDAGASVQDLTLAHGRSRGGIASRLVRLGRIQDRAEITPRRERWGENAAKGPSGVPASQRMPGDASTSSSATIA